MYIFVGQVGYWATYIPFAIAGHAWLGILIGVFVSLLACIALWRIEFGTWDLWS